MTSSLPSVVVGDLIRATHIDNIVSWMNYAWIDVKDYGAVGDGTTDDTTAIQAAINALPTAGGVVHFPKGIYKVMSTITVGNGTNSLQSTRHNVALLGAAVSGTGADVSNTELEGSVLKWGGSAGGTVLQVVGPIHNVVVKDIKVDGQDLAATGISIIHLTQGHFENVVVTQWTGTAWVLTSRDNFPTGVAYGNSDNRFVGCYAFDPQQASCNALQLTSGVSSAVSLVGRPDSARNIFVGGTFTFGGTAGSSGVELAGADNNCFIGTLFEKSSLGSGGASVLFTQWTSSTSWPLENIFYNCALPQGVSGASGTGGNFFLPFPTSDGATIPTGANLIALAPNGNLTGTRTSGIHYSEIASATAIANTVAATAFNKTYTVPANSIDRAGTVLRIRASGIYSTTGTPTLTLFLRIATVIIAHSGGVTTPADATNKTWSYSADIVARSVGVSGSMQRGFAFSVLDNTAGTALVSGNQQGSGTFTLDTTAAETVDVVAQWGTASTSNTVTLETLEVEVLYPSATS